MILFKDLQTRTTELIAEHAFFAGQTVLEDRGDKEKEIEQALRTVGQVVFVPLIPAGDTNRILQGGGTAILDCTLAVHIFQNPKKASLDVYEMMAAVKSALLGYNPRNPKDVYRLNSEAFRISYDDAGLIIYTMAFDKDCAI